MGARVHTDGANCCGCYANAPTAANSLLIRDFPAAGTAGAATARDISIGHTATNQLMFASANISRGPSCRLTIWYTYSAVVGSGGTGGAFDLHDDVTGSLTFAGMNAADRILLSDESGVGEPNVYTTTAIAASYFKSIAPWDLHDDVSITATIAADDRIVFSDESAVGDPTRFDQYGDMRTDIRADIYDETTELTTNMSRLIFVGDGVTASHTGGHVTVTIPGGSGGGTTVVANPGGSPTTNLSTVTIGTTDYQIPAFDIHDDVSAIATPITDDRFLF